MQGSNHPLLNYFLRGGHWTPHRWGWTCRHTKKTMSTQKGFKETGRALCDWHTPEECYFTTAEYIFLQCDCVHAFHSTSCDVVTTLLVKMDVCLYTMYFR